MVLYYVCFYKQLFLIETDMCFFLNFKMHGPSCAYKNHLFCVLQHTHTHAYTSKHIHTQIHTHRTTPPIPSVLYFPNLPALCHLLSLYLHMPNTYLHLNVHFKKFPSMCFTNSLFSLNFNIPCPLL